MKKGVLVVSVLVLSLFGWVGYTFYKAYQPKVIIFQGEVDAQVYNISSKLPPLLSTLGVLFLDADFI